MQILAAILLNLPRREAAKLSRFSDEVSPGDALSDPEKWFKVNVVYKTVDTALVHLR